MTATLIHGECLAEMAKLPDASIDMVLCDLPYGTSACSWDAVIPPELLWKEYMRLARGAGAVVLTASQPFTTTLIASNLQWFKYALVWEKNRTGGFWDAKFRPLKCHEDICMFSRGGCSNGSKLPMIYNPQGLLPGKGNWTNKPISSGSRTGSDRVGKRAASNYPRSVLKFDAEATPVHPTQKPVALMEYLIKTYTHEGMTVLDNCMGSGTTGVACARTNRNFIGIEQDAGYFEIASKRIREAQESAPISLQAMAA